MKHGWSENERGRLYHTLGVFAFCALLILPMIASAAPGRFCMASSFENRLGTWTIINYTNSLSGQILYGQIDGDPSDAFSAQGEADIPATGQYRVWVRCREFQFDRPGIRFFDVRLGNGFYQERFADEGLHDGLGWEDGGIVTLNAGSLPIQIIDTSAGYARFDALLLTPDLSSTPPPDSLSGVEAIADLVTSLPPAPPLTNLLVMPVSFANNLGTWQFISEEGSLTGQILKGLQNHDVSAAPAMVTADVPTTDTYRVWVRCREYASFLPGTRYFNVRLNDGVYDERFADEGSHEGYGWEIGTTVTLRAGDLKIELVDSSSYFARFDAIFLTNDINFTPPDTYEALLQIATLVESRFGDSATQPPDWATSEDPPTAQEEIGNDLVRVQFFQTPSDSHTIVQKQTSVFREGAWHAIGDRTDLFTYVALYAKEFSYAGNFDFASSTWHCVTEGPGGLTTQTTANIFQAGELQWLVPSEMRKIDSHTMELKAATDLATLTATWSIPIDLAEPIVQCDLLAAQTGSYSLGMANGPETEMTGVNYVLCAKPYLGKYIPPIPAIVRENVSSNATSLMSLAIAQPIAGLDEISYGVIPDPSSIPYRWANETNSLFGLGIRGPLGGAQPWLFAPLPGGEGSALDAGEIFSFTYRPLIQPGGWNDLFRHVTDDILEIRDVKKNYYASLTDTIFNVQDLILSEQQSSGWNEKAMAHAYVETPNGTINNYNHSSPLTLVQNYLFTEDRDWYVKRTIPTMAYNLSRPGKWIGLPSSEPLPTNPVSLTGIASWPSSVVGGFYLMSRGQTTAYRQAGFQGAFRRWGLGRMGNQGAPDMTFMEEIYRYRFTQDPALLASARAGADEYIALFVDWTPDVIIAGSGFEIMTTAPWLPALLSMYEVTGETKYLDAAEDSARKLIAHGTWVQPKVPDGNVFLSAETLKSEGFFHDSEIAGSSVHGWNGDTRMILGYQFPGDHYPTGAPIERAPGAFDNLQDETVPAWLLSRVGRNMEHGPQLSPGGFRSPNITMTCYTADLARLAEYTGESFYETVARHDTIGIAANYPGYYVDRMMTNYMKADYPFVGPDISCIEYTHIPPFLAKIEDFLITMAWTRSDKQVEFPWIRQYGYAYFDNKVYGFAPGRFFDLNAMWIWLKRGLIEVDNVQIDWLGARKNGLFAAALMNQDDQAINITVTLGNEITGGTALSGSATVYSAAGQKTTAPVSNSQLALTVPAKGIIGFTVESSAVLAPRFANSDLTDVDGVDTNQTIALPQGIGDFGPGYVLQIDPRSYFAYTVLPYKPDQVQTATLHFRIGEGAWQSVTVDSYPFEHIEEVTETSQTFTFYWTIVDGNGDPKQSTEKQLQPLQPPRTPAGALPVWDRF
ncbi:hypothetical protein HQ520_10355 [bacterium]|nr:hypothetical protein [bacterium]